jgi:sulfur-oxidizing protein SoxX
MKNRALTVWLVLLSGAGIMLSGTAIAQEAQMESGGFFLPKGDPEAGRKDFSRLGCVACHRVAGDPDLPAPISPTPGPTLNFGPAVPAGTIAQSIIAPSHTIAPDFGQGTPEDPQVSPMHDFADEMTLRELRDITAYLQSRQY